MGLLLETGVIVMTVSIYRYGNNDFVGTSPYYYRFDCHGAPNNWSRLKKWEIGRTTSTCLCYLYL